jgi:hypothetical protein
LIRSTVRQRFRNGEVLVRSGYVPSNHAALVEEIRLVESVVMSTIVVFAMGSPYQRMVFDVNDAKEYGIVDVGYAVPSAAHRRA